MNQNDVFVIDNFLSEEEHKKLFFFLRSANWTSQWSSVDNRRVEGAWHWNFGFYESRQFMPPLSDADYEKLKETYPAVVPLWDKVKETVAQKIGEHNLLRLYANCNPYGTNAYIHADDGDYTCVYYPALEWNSEWEGGTCFYDFKDFKGTDGEVYGSYDAIRYVTYRPNRIIMFPAQIPHRGMPVDKICHVPRYVVAMKLQRDVNSAAYLQNYYKGKV